MNEVKNLAGCTTLLVATLLLGACGGGSSGSASSGGSATEAPSATSPGNPTPPATGSADTTPPTIIGTTPANDATGVPTAALLFATFDEALDESSLDDDSLVVLEQGVRVAGSVEYDAPTKRLSFVADAPLAMQTVYEVTVASTVHDAAGNAFLGHRWFFTTGDAFNLGSTSQMTIDLCMDDGDKLMLTLVNNARAVDRSCGSTAETAQPPLSWNCLLDQAAVGHSTAMADNDFHAHVSPVDGSDPGDRINAVGYSPQAWGENIAAGYANEETVVQAWLDSPGHCSNLMSPSFTELGAGFARNASSTFGIYWTQKFANPR